VTKGFYPKAIVKNIAPGSNDPAIKPRVAILHVAISEGESLFGWFNGPSGGVESHFYIRRDGTVEQYRSIYFQADANFDANDFAVSIETQGMGPGRWTRAQVRAIKALLLWLHNEADIPLHRCKVWDGAGVGYHSSFAQWNHAGKPCPGADRIKQFNGELTRWMRLRRALEAGSIFKPKHRIVSANLHVNNPDPIAAANQIVAKVKARFSWVPDVIAFQETQRDSTLSALNRVEGYSLFAARDKGEAGRELGVLLHDTLKCLGVEFTKAADGVKGGDPVFDHPRGIFVVKYLKRRRKVAVVNTHMGVFGEDRTANGSVPGEAAQQHAVHARRLLNKVRELEAAGFLVFVTADANSTGEWDESLPAVLEDGGLRLSQNRIDLVASDPKRVRAPEVLVIPKTAIASDHAVVAISCQEK